MARSFPPDVIVLDTDALLHVRFGRGRSKPRIVQAKPYRLAADTFTPAPVTPELAAPASLAEALRRLRGETGRWDKVSLLLPDSWFRINIVDIPALAEREDEALEMVRWSLKRTLPIPPEQLRVTYVVLRREGRAAKVLVLSALESTLATIEKTFAAVGLDIVLIEPLGLNIWNALAVRESDAAADRILVYVRESDFTTAVFRGPEPLFIRSRNLTGERTVDQEIRLSASYLRDSLAVESFESCYVAGERGDAVRDTLASEFNTQVRSVDLRDLVEEIPAGVAGLEAEVTACAGVFTT